MAKFTKNAPTITDLQAEMSGSPPPAAVADPVSEKMFEEMQSAPRRGNASQKGKVLQMPKTDDNNVLDTPVVSLTWKAPKILWDVMGGAEMTIALDEGITVKEAADLAAQITSELAVVYDVAGDDFWKTGKQRDLAFQLAEEVNADLDLMITELKQPQAVLDELFNMRGDKPQRRGGGGQRGGGGYRGGGGRRDDNAEMVPFECDECGAEGKVKLSVAEWADKQNKPLLCKACYDKAQGGGGGSYKRGGGNSYQRGNSGGSRRFSR